MLLLKKLWKSGWVHVLTDRTCDPVVTLLACAACCPYCLKMRLNMFEIASFNLLGLMTQSVFQSRQKVREHGKELKHPAISQTSGNSGAVVANPHCSMWLLRRYIIIHIQIIHMRHLKCLLFLPSNTAVHCFPDRKELSTPPNRSPSIPWKCHQTVYICLFSLAAWHLTQSLHALWSYNSAPLQSYMDIMCSLCFQSKCLWRHCLWLTPPTLPAQPENTTHTHTILHCQKLLRLGTGEF